MNVIVDPTAADAAIIIQQLLSQSLAEDVGTGDLTTAVCIAEGVYATGTFHVKEGGVIAGLPFLEPFFQELDANLQVTLLAPEGSWQRAGCAVAQVCGPARPLITAERSALNFLQHASGIATTTASYVKKVKSAGCSCAILDTRKTLPGLRSVEKYAVATGGGVNHRLGLSDRFILKANHLAFSGPLTASLFIETVASLRHRAPHIPIDIEVGSLELADKALQADIDGIMLYGMSPQEVRKAVIKAHSGAKKAFFQTAVDLPMDAIVDFARTGVDGIAIGALITKASPLDIGMRLLPMSAPISFISRL